MQPVLHSGYLYKSGSVHRGTLTRKTREGGGRGEEVREEGGGSREEGGGAEEEGGGGASWVRVKGGFFGQKKF